MTVSSTTAPPDAAAAALIGFSGLTSPPAALRSGLHVGDGGRSARRALLAQIARLEGELVEQRCSAWPRLPRTDPPREPQQRGSRTHVPGNLERRGSRVHVPGDLGRRGPRLLSLGELEERRDELVAAVSAERQALAERSLREERSRRLREELMLDPAAHPGARVRNADVGEGGCGEVRSEPTGGVLGMLMGWWRVVVSSGCP